MAISGLQLLQQIRNALARAVDPSTWGLTMIDHEEHDIHGGRGFTAHYESEAPLPTNAGEETAIGFITPPAASGRIHMIIDVQANEESVWELREDPAITLDQGSGLLALNRFRDSTNATGLLSNQAVTAGNLTSYDVAEAAAGDLSGGVILEHETIAIGGTAPFAGSSNGQVRGQREWILKAETEYVIILTSSTANTTTHTIKLNWSEDTHKNE